MLFRYALYALITGTAIAILGVLITNTRGVDTQHQQQALESLRELGKLNAQWDASILRSSLGLSNDYDPLAAEAAQISQVHKTLAQHVASADTGKDSLRHLIETKTAQVDRFKAQNSILRNSLRYLPTAFDELAALYQRTPDEQRPALEPLERQGRGILDQLLRYNLFPGPDLRKRIEQDIDTLSQAVDQAPRTPETTPLLEQASSLANHGRTILRQRELVGQLMEEIQAIPIPQALERMTDEVDSDINAQRGDTDRYRLYLVAYSALLLLAVFYFAVSLVRSFRKLAVANRSLSEANETLEDRVVVRTLELSQALEDLKSSEASLVQSEKMASLGQMVAGVAHEINTPLAYVRSSLETVESNITTSPLRVFYESAEKLVQLMRADGANESDIAEQFMRAAEASDQLGGEGSLLFDEMGSLVKDGIYGVDQIRELVVNLKNFSRLDKSRVSRYQLEEGVESSLLLAKHEVKHRRVVRRFQSVPSVHCSPSQINQVLLNIITNAVHATEDGTGTLVISTYQPDANHVALSIADNGRGIPPEVMDRVFDPFFTTKDIGQGTGLGLSIAYKIIQQHGGTIQVDSPANLGTRFTLTLPIEPSGPDAAAHIAGERVSQP